MSRLCWSASLRACYMCMNETQTDLELSPSREASSGAVTHRFYFMGPEVSLPCSQEPSTGPYPDLDQSSPYRIILRLVSSVLILS
jgi:hypothetical protein